MLEQNYIPGPNGRYFNSIAHYGDYIMDTLRDEMKQEKTLPFDTSRYDFFNEYEHKAYAAYMRAKYDELSSKAAYYVVSFNKSTYHNNGQPYSKRIEVKENGYHRVTTVVVTSLETGYEESVTVEKQALA